MMKEPLNTGIEEILKSYYDDLITFLPNLIAGLIVVLLFIVLGKLFYRVLGRRIQRRWKDSIVSSFVAESTKWIIYFLGVIIALNIIGFGGVASGIIAGAGIGAIIMGFAFKDIGENFLSGILLTLSRPFEIGDIIEVDSFKGTVRDLDLRVTHLRNVDGRDIYIPNSVIIKNTLVNYTIDDILRMSFTIGVAPESDLEAVRTIIMDYFAQNKYILKKPAPNVLVQELGEFTVDLNVLFWLDIMIAKHTPDEYLGNTVRSQVITDIKTLLDENNIQMPSQVLEHKMYRDERLVMEKRGRTNKA